MRRLLGATAAALFVGLLPVPWAPAQPPTPDDELVFGELLNVELVLVDLFAEDKSGDPVLDLARDEVQVFEDGSPVEIVEFSAPTAERRASAEGEAGPEPAVPGARVVVFIDDLHLGPLSRKRVFASLADLLKDGLGPRDEVMVVTFDGTVHVALPMSRDRSELRRVLREQTEFGVVSLLAGFGEERTLELLATRQAMETQGAGPTGGDPCVDSGFIARTHAEQVHARVQQTIGELERFVNSLAGYPGRKVLLHVSDGIPLVAGETVFRSAIELCDGSGFNKGVPNAVDTMTFGPGKYTRWDPSRGWAEMQEFNTTDEWTRLAAQANTYQVSFYTLQAGAGELNRSSRVDGAKIGADTEMAGRRNVQDTLFLLADETGGRAILNGGDFRPAVERMLDERHLAYQIGYAPPSPGDGRQHRIKVTTTRPGVELRFRRGYRSKTIHERIADGVLSSLFHERQDNPLGAHIEVASQTPGTGRATNVRVRIRLPLDQLVLLPEGEVGRGLFTVFVAARDGRGGLTPVGSKTVPIRVAAGDEARSYVYEVEIPLQGKEPVVAVALRDEIGGEASYLRKVVRLTASS